MTIVIVNDTHSMAIITPIEVAGPSSGEDIVIELLETEIDVEVVSDLLVVLEPDTIQLGLEEVLNVELVEETINVGVEDEINVVLLEDEICVCYDEGT